MEYPFASSPDVIRTHQKDAYYTASLHTQASNILRALLGARFAHTHSTTTFHLTELLYLCLTTLLGNRTLGEEYCDVIQTEDDTLRLPHLGRRLGYISSIVFAPWILSRSLPALRRRLRAKLEHNVDRLRQLQKPSDNPTRSLRIQSYLLAHLDSLTSLTPVYALSLAIFYFTGSYYHLSKRLWGLRYIFTRQLRSSEPREGYEVLGVLMVLQMAVQAVLHARETLSNASDSATPTKGSLRTPLLPATTATVGPGVELPLQTTALTQTQTPPSSEDPYLPPGLPSTTATPPTTRETAIVNLTSPLVLSWIQPSSQRKCTLCLEPYHDPSVTTCGHVFCWTCVQDWIREKPECPLCRQRIMGEKCLPLRDFGE